MLTAINTKRVGATNPNGIQYSLLVTHFNTAQYFGFELYNVRN